MYAHTYIHVYIYIYWDVIIVNCIDAIAIHNQQYGLSENEVPPLVNHIIFLPKMP